MATGTTTPRKRTAAKSTAAKATPAKVAPKAESANSPAIVKDGDGTTKVTFELAFVNETKNYAKFEVPTGNGCVGAIYAPIGTETVKVLLIGPADTAE